ncbi:MAG: dihydroxy-acid dehydratase [Spirochaetaceae bacterium]|nr:dihydroxy-acid dehydratase [Spirochaetaceae bacterium]
MARPSPGIDGRLTDYGDPGFSSFLRRAFLASAGYDDADVDRPVVAIVDTSSDYTTCHRDMPALLAAVRRGVLQGGALPLTLPTLSLGEILISPTSMLYRNLLAMETEEALTAYPMDAAVLLGGCDKTVPAQLMAAASADVPVVSVVTGPMRTGFWRGTRLGACTDCRAHWQQFRAGELAGHELSEVQQELCPTGGTCMVMGTASTMACLGEALGLMLPGGAAAPSGSGARLRHAVASGRRAAALAQAPVRPRQVLTAAAFANAVSVLLAIGGSTNAIIHLLAIARRAGVPLTLADFEAAAARVPLLVNCKPSGALWLEDLHRAGGMPAVLAELRPLLHLDARCVSGRTLGEQLAARRVSATEVAEAAGGAGEAGRSAASDKPPEAATTNAGSTRHEVEKDRSERSLTARSIAPDRVIGTLDEPIGPPGALTVLRGSLAPDGAVLKRSAATPALLRHRGPALVFESPADLADRIDDPDLPVTPGHVLVLRNSGPAAAGMPETGSVPIPRKLAEAGVRDMVRVSDARMSGTAGGTVVLHCSPEAARGGPLALVEDGDQIELDADRGRIDLLVSERELAARRTRAPLPPAPPRRGWRRLHAEHVLPAHLGADLDFLAPDPGTAKKDGQ